MNKLTASNEIKNKKKCIEYETIVKKLTKEIKIQKSEFIENYKLTKGALNSEITYLKNKENDISSKFESDNENIENEQNIKMNIKNDKQKNLSTTYADLIKKMTLE